jgi:hypothetical protein
VLVQRDRFVVEVAPAVVAAVVVVCLGKEGPIQAEQRTQQERQALT